VHAIVKPPKAHNTLATKAVICLARFSVTLGVLQPPCIVALSPCASLVSLRPCTQEHVSEYGRHWNFFFTLGAVSLAGALLPLHGASAGAAAMAAIAAYQAALSDSRVTAWLTAAHRLDESLLDANKEGVVSLAGYFAIYWSGAALSSVLLPPRGPNVASELGKINVRASTWYRQLVLLSACGWAAALWLDATVQPVSRRFCNAAYVCWITASAVTQLLLAALACQGVIMVSLILGRGTGRSSHVVQALSHHQLAAFLAANLSTGLVNMSVDTLDAPTWLAVLLLVAHMAVWCTVGIWTPWLTSAWASNVSKAKRV
jgi:glucosaminylphosphatidylinositol acyltransferase